jgi:hypothetical protein
MTFDLAATAATAETVVEDIMKVEPVLANIAGAFIPGVSAFQSMLTMFAPYVENALKAVAASNGGNALMAQLEVLNHMTPGMPNSPTLSSPPAPTPIHVTEAS